MWSFTPRFLVFCLCHRYIFVFVFLFCVRAFVLDVNWLRLRSAGKLQETLLVGKPIETPTLIWNA